MTCGHPADYVGVIQWCHEPAANRWQCDKIEACCLHYVISHFVLLPRSLSGISQTWRVYCDTRDYNCLLCILCYTETMKVIQLHRFMFSLRNMTSHNKQCDLSPHSDNKSIALHMAVLYPSYLSEPDLHRKMQVFKILLIIRLNCLGLEQLLLRRNNLKFDHIFSHWIKFSANNWVNLRNLLIRRVTLQQQPENFIATWSSEALL
jgi:hypothetical protein